MERLLTDKTVSLAELKDPRKVIDNAEGQPVAVLDGDRLEGYFVPAGAVGKIDVQVTDTSALMAAFKRRRSKIAGILKYLEDKQT